jgi:hypothetical protein
MCENMGVSKVCAVSEVLCSISDEHYTEFGNYSVSDEVKGRRDHTTRVSYVRRRETYPRNVHLVSYERAFPLYLTCTKKNVYEIFYTKYSLRQHATCPLAHKRKPMCANGYPMGPHKKHHVEHKLSDIFEAPKLSWVQKRVTM